MWSSYPQTDKPKHKPWSWNFENAALWFKLVCTYILIISTLKKLLLYFLEKFELGSCMIGSDFRYKHLWTTNFKAKKILNKFCRIIKLLRNFRSSTDQCANRGSSGKAYRIVMIHYGQYCFIIPKKLWNLHLMPLHHHQKWPSIKDIGNKATKFVNGYWVKNCQHGRGRYHKSSKNCCCLSWSVQKVSWWDIPYFLI